MQIWEKRRRKTKKGRAPDEDGDDGDQRFKKGTRIAYGSAHTSPCLPALTRSDGVRDGKEEGVRRVSDYNGAVHLQARKEQQQQPSPTREEGG